MGMAEELEKLEDLHRRGALTEAEFTSAKARVLGGTSPPPDIAGQEGDATVDPDRDLARWLRPMQIFSIALLSGLVVFLAISLFIVLVVNNGQGQAPPQGLPVFSLVAWAMLAVCGPLSFLMPGMLTQAALRQSVTGTRQVSPGTHPVPIRAASSRLLSLRLITLITGLAFLEGAAFAGCIAYELEGHVAVLAVPGIALVLMLLRFPTESRVRAWLGRQAEVLAELRRQDSGGGGDRG